MAAEAFYEEVANSVQHATGVVIPVYIPQAVDPVLAGRLLRDTAAAFRREVADPRRICLSVDGPGAGLAAAEDVARALGVRVVASAVNRGKFHAARNGMTRLLEDSSVRYAAVVDQDGDHFANELLNFVRAADHVERSTGTRAVMVLGRRISRHRPMGFLRGELEELADRMLLDALHYQAAVNGKPLRMEFATTLEEYPDFHSGYKLFTRDTAAAVFGPEPATAGLPADAGSRHAVEAIMSVEAILSGALLTVVNRSTLDEQPVTTFGLLNRRRMIADKILWPCKRMEVPGAFVAQWMANHLPRLMLGTLVPEGKAELLDIHRLVLEAYGLPAPGDDILRPKFI